MPEIVLEIGPDTGDVPVPVLPPEHEWASARLRVRAEPSVTFTPPLAAPGDPAQGVPWVSAAWDAMRPITGLAITWVGQAPSSLFVAMKVATGGVWFTPVPPGRVDPKSFQPVFRFRAGKDPRFPPVLASALLLELQGPAQADSAEPEEVLGKLEKIVITAQNAVIDLSIAVGNAPPILQHRGRLDEAIDLDLTPALRAAPPGAALKLRAATAATVRVTWDPQTLRRPSTALLGPPVQAVVLGDTARWTQPLAGEQLVAVAGKLAWNGAAERSLREPATVPSVKLAQAVFPGQDAAQALGPLVESPRGVDLWIAARTASAGLLRLVGERAGHPTDKPLAETAWSLAAGASRWISVTVPPKSGGPLSVVCQATQGDVLVARALVPDEPGVALQRRAGGPWAAVDEPETDCHLHIRIRVDDPARTPGPVTARRGSVVVVVVVRSDGGFALSPAQLAAINGAIGPLLVEVSAPGTGTLTLTDWQLRLAASPL